MLTKNDIKLIRSLSMGKFRKQHSCFLVEGAKIIEEFHKENANIQRIFSTKDSKLSSDLKSEIISNAELNRISQLSSPNECLAIIKLPENEIPKPKALVKKLIVLCDKIQDPGNMGTIIRISDWFGIDNVICSSDSTDVYSPKVVQASMGSLARTKVTYTDLNHFIAKLKTEDSNYPIVVSSLTGKNIYKSDLPERCGLVLGNESKGVSDEIQKMADLTVMIPAYGAAESLNVAVSAGIMLSEFRRRS